MPVVMKVRQISVWGGLVLFGAASPAQANEPDPCAFAASTAPAFSHDQVMACYQRVPFDPADLANIVQVVAQHRSFSDLGEIYEERVHWKQALAALDDPSTEQDYPNDMALHDALKREHQRFRNGHVAYLPPACYWQMLNAIVPLNFGSTRWGAGGRAEQIIFVEGAGLVDLYRQATGIDLGAVIGQRVVSINGIPVLDYFRAYAEALKSHEDPGGGLNGVLNALTYSFRLNGPFDFVPDRPADEYVFESVDGERQALQLPWVFIPSSLVLGDLAVPLTASTEEFVELCRLGPPQATPVDGEASLLRAAGPLAPLALDRERQRALQSLQASTTAAVPSPPAVAGAVPSSRRPDAPTSFYEVAPEQLGQGIELIVPLTNSAAVRQYDGHVTALQLLDTGGWIDVARQGIEYACEHSDRLIVDLRNNAGGNDTVIRWLHHYLFPERGQLVRGGMLPFRLRNDVPALNEFLFNSARFMAEYAPGLGVEPCAFFLTPGCLTDPGTGAPLEAGPDWFAHPSVVEERGGVALSLSRFVSLPNIGDPEFDSASCAGRFQGDDLVFITDGSNASGGYFLPASFKGEGVIVSVGGFVGEPMAMGRATGGATFPGGVWAPWAEAIELVTEGAIRFEHELVGFTRPVGTQMEMLGIYRRNRRELHLEQPVGADLHVDVWSDLPGSEGFVFQRVLDAVDAHAGEEPAHPPR
jgi:hypothetical protein